MPYSLRAAVPGDEHALALVGQATFLETFAGVLDGADVVAHCRDQHAAARYAEWLRRPSAALGLAEAQPGGAPIGYFWLDAAQLPVPDPRDTDVELKRIYVLGRFHGTGTGAGLMAAALAAARARGARRMLLGVYAANERARGFYARQGFRQVADRRFRVGRRSYDDAVLALEL
jgi:GNAT superfamily N-acetyltransferase